MRVYLTPAEIEAMHVHGLYSAQDLLQYGMHNCLEQDPLLLSAYSKIAQAIGYAMDSYMAGG